MNAFPIRRAVTGAVAIALLAALPTALGGPAQAANQSVTITPTGYVPENATLEVGQTVTFTNADTTVHQVDIKPSTGFTCNINPVVIASTKQAVCTFNTAGTYTVTDPQGRGNTYRLVLAVTAASPVLSSVSATAADSLVVYGSSTQIRGDVNLNKSGVQIDLFAKEFGAADFTKVATTTTGGNGSYSFNTTPKIGTEYRVKATDGSRTADSATVAVRVRPKVTLILRYVRGANAGFRTTATSSVSYSGKQVFVQRRNSAGGWTTVRTLTLNQFSARSFRQKVPVSVSSAWRVMLPASQAGGGYLAGISPVKVVSR